MYITQTEYEAYLGTTLTATEASQFEFFANTTTQMINNRIGDISRGNRLLKIPYSNIFFEWWATKIYTGKINVRGIVTINSEAYTGEVKIDGRLKDIVFLDDYTFDSTDYPFVEILLDCGFDANEIPGDIKLLQAYLIRDMVTQTKGGDIVKKKIGDKELQFSANTSENIQQFIDGIFSSYTIIHI